MPAALATASAITPISAPWRSSPPSRRRRNVCSTSVAAREQCAEQFGAAGLRSLARDTAPISLNVASTPRTVRRRFGGRLRQRAQRRPPDADLPLRQLAGQPRDDDGDQPGVVIGCRPACSSVGDAGDLGQPRRGRADVGGRGGDVYEQHPHPDILRPPELRASDIDRAVIRREGQRVPARRAVGHRVGALGRLRVAGVVGGAHRDLVEPGILGLPGEAPQPPGVVGVAVARGELAASRRRRSGPRRHGRRGAAPTRRRRTSPGRRARPAPLRGTSMRDSVLIGPRADQPSRVQYASARSKRVTSRSTTHLVADT